MTEPMPKGYGQTFMITLHAILNYAINQHAYDNMTNAFMSDVMRGCVTLLLYKKNIHRKSYTILLD